MQKVNELLNLFYMVQLQVITKAGLNDFWARLTILKPNDNGDIQEDLEKQVRLSEHHKFVRVVSGGGDQGVLDQLSRRKNSQKLLLPDSLFFTTLL